MNVDNPLRVDQPNPSEERLQRIRVTGVADASLELYRRLQQEGWVAPDVTMADRLAEMEIRAERAEAKARRAQALLGMIHQEGVEYFGEHFAEAIAFAMMGDR